MDPYKILGIDKNASLEEVQRAYRMKARKHHPDMGGDAWAFQQVREAYEKIARVRTTAGQCGETKPRAAAPHATTPTSPSPNTASHERKRPVQTRGLWDHVPRSLVQAKDQLQQVCFRQLPLQDETTLFILFSALDIFMTYILMRFGGIETNPIARFFYARWAFGGMIFFKMGMIAFITVLAQVIALRSLNSARRVLQFGTIVVAMVVVYSAFLLVRHF